MSTKREKLCGCLADLAHPEHIRLYIRFPEIDILEWRLDSTICRHSLETTLDAFQFLSLSPRLPVLATNRPKREGGAFEGAESQRLEVLHKAVKAGAEWVDLEDDTSREAIESFRSEKARVLVSHHDFAGTPDKPTLQRLVENMAKKNPDIIKITTYAQSPEDNLAVLDLIPFGRREFGKDVIAFCMGALGRWSRVACLLMGSPWSYVQLPGQTTTAPGQLAVNKMRTLLNIMLKG